MFAFANFADAVNGDHGKFYFPPQDIFYPSRCGYFRTQRACCGMLQIDRTPDRGLSLYIKYYSIFSHRKQIFLQNRMCQVNVGKKYITRKIGKIELQIRVKSDCGQP